MAENRGPIDFTPSPELFPFESRWFDSSVGAVHYIDEGAGRPILMLHGNPMWSFLYRHLVERLKGDYRCVAVDYPGFGLSVRPQGYGYTAREHAGVVGELVDQLGLEDFIVMGQDWGGPIGMGVAVERSERVHGLVMGNTWFWPAQDRTFRYFSATLSSGPAQYLILKRNWFVTRLMPMAMARKLTSQETRHYRAVQPNAAMRKGAAVFPREIRAARPWMAEVEARLQETLVDKPLLLVWGMKDMGFKPSRFLPRWRETFNAATLVKLPKAKHYIQEDAPDQVAAAIRERFPPGS